jgi:hypothetical protein
MNRGELRYRVLADLNEDPLHPVYFNLDEVNTYLQEAYEVLCEESTLIKRTFTIPRRAGTLVYQLPGVGSNIMAPYRIWLPDLKRRLESATLTDFEAKHEKWMTITNVPWYWAAVSWDQFIVWPAPTTGQGFMEVDCYCWPTPMVDDSDEPEFHASMHEALQDYAEGVGHLKQWNVAEIQRLWQTVLGEFRHARAQGSVNQSQGRFWNRSTGRSDTRSGRGY